MLGPSGGLDRTQTAIVGIVYVSYLETGAFTRKTAGAEGRHTALVGNLGGRVGPVHELRQCVGAEECIDYRRDCLGVDKIGRGKHLVVTYVHTLADCARHTVEAHAELIRKLLADSAYAAVRQVVDIVHVCVAVDKLDQIFDNGNDILLGQHLHVHAGCEAELAVDAVAAYIAKVITLLREEEVENYLAGTYLVGGFGIAELTIDVLDSLFL